MSAGRGSPALVNWVRHTDRMLVNVGRGLSGLVKWSLCTGWCLCDFTYCVCLANFWNFRYVYLSGNVLLYGTGREGNRVYVPPLGFLADKYSGAFLVCYFDGVLVAGDVTAVGSEFAKEH